MSEIPIGAWLEAMADNRGASYAGRPIPALRLNDDAGLTDSQKARLRRLLKTEGDA